MFAPLLATLIGLRYPSDGWSSTLTDSGAYQLCSQVTTDPGPLQVGDLIVAIDGQPLLPRRLPPLPSDLQAGQMLRYTVEREVGGQTVLFTPIREAIAKLDQTDAASVAHLHRQERWRERLLTEDNDALTQLLSEVPNADSQRLRQMIRNAQQEHTAGEAPQVITRTVQISAGAIGIVPNGLAMLESPRWVGLKVD